MIVALLFIVVFVVSVSLIPFSDFDLSLPSVKAPQNNSSSISIKFEEESIAWKLVKSHQQNSLMLTNIRQIVGSGVCVLDANGDGWEDLFIIGGSGEHRFYGRPTWWTKKHDGNSIWLNNYGKNFYDATAYSKITTNSWPMGCGAADFDNDGDTDLFVTYIGSNQLLINDGDGKFEDVSIHAGFKEDNSWSTSVALADYNNDGLIDIYVTNFIRYQEGAKVFEQASGYLESIKDPFNPDLYDSQPNRLYKNLGDLKFQEVSKEANVDDISGRGNAARWIDINNDNYMDLLVLNSGGTPNRLFINTGPEDKYTFNDAPPDYHVKSANGAHSVASGDIDSDGDTDLIITSPAGTPPLLLIQRNKEYAHDRGSNNALTDLAWEKGIADNNRLYQEGWGSVIADFNNDSNLDLFIGNGASVVDMDSSYVTVAQPDALWVGRGNGSFSPTSFSSNFPSPTRGVVKSDFNHDGKIDLFTTQNNGYVRLLINSTDTHYPWIGFILDTKTSNPNGSKVEVITSNGTKSKILTIDSSYLSQSSSYLHFPLPDKTTRVDVQITWSNGEKLVYPNLLANKYWKLRKDGSSNLLPSKQASTVLNGEFFSALTSSQQNEFINTIFHLLEKPHTNLTSSEKIKLTSELRDNFSKYEIDIRSAILKLVAKIPSNTSLVLIRNGLDDPEPKVRISAINALKTLELELSIPWLISSTMDKNADVRCEAAKTFEFLFHEEEAVVKRKGLGIPSLVRLLEDPVPKVRLCAIRALAETESYRAIRPLANILNSNDHTESSIVRGNSARALGYIRDRRAINALLTAINRKTQDPYVIAHCLIALKRLNYNGLESLLENNLYLDPDTSSVNQQFNIATVLLTDSDDKTVLDRDLVLSYFSNAIESLKDAENKSPVWLPKMLEFLQISNSPLAESIFLRYINHADNNISNKALSSLSKSYRPLNGLSSWNFYSRDTATKVKVIQNLLNEGFKPSIVDAKKLLIDPSLESIFFDHFLHSGYPHLLALISSYPSSAKAKIDTLLDLCIKTNHVYEIAPSSWFSSNDHFTKKLSCWEKTKTLEPSKLDIKKLMPMVYSSVIKDQQLALRVLAKHPDKKADQFLIRLIKDRSASSILREYALKTVINNKKFYANGLAMSLARQKNSQISQYAGSIVDNIVGRKQAKSTLLRQANNKSLNPNERWHYINKLVLQYDYNLLDLL